MNFRYLSIPIECKIKELSNKFFGRSKKGSYTRFITEVTLYIDSHQQEFEKWIKDRRSMKFIEKEQGLPIN
jgi:hypothetical protein